MMHARKQQGCGSRRGHWHRSRSTPEDVMSGPFGVRRPLRFLSHKLGLDDEQAAVLAEVLDDIKTERAQEAVDDRRAQKLYAEALADDAFDLAKAHAAAERRLEARRRVQTALAEGLQRLHATLDADQRRQLTLLLRSGALSV
jgi:Spy/CpxP family protein refolding chaperone